MGRKGKHKRPSYDSDDRTIRIMIKGKPYEVEYGSRLTLKSLETGQEAPLDIIPVDTLHDVSDALADAHEELDECEATINAMIETNQASMNGVPYKEKDEGNNNWSTKKEDTKTDVDDEKYTNEGGYGGAYAGHEC